MWKVVEYNKSQLGRNQSWTIDHTEASGFTAPPSLSDAIQPAEKYTSATKSSWDHYTPVAHAYRGIVCLQTPCRRHVRSNPAASLVRSTASGRRQQRVDMHQDRNTEHRRKGVQPVTRRVCRPLTLEIPVSKRYYLGQRSKGLDSCKHPKCSM
jgi:hypothetical protein